MSLGITPGISVTAMLDKLQWPTLSDRRYYLTAAMMYKIVHNLVAIEATSYLTPITSATRGHLKRYLHIQTRTNAYYHSFFPSAVRIWNNLLACSVTASSLEQFKSLINLDLITNFNIVHTCAKYSIRGLHSIL